MTTFPGLTSMTTMTWTWTTSPCSPTPLGSMARKLGFACLCILILCGTTARDRAYGAPPTVTLVSPADQDTVNQTAVTFACSATDDIGLLEATLYLGNSLETVTFSGPTETEDAQISADQPNSNEGEGTSINVDGENPHAHGLIRFPDLFGGGLGQLPLGSSIVQATLEINCTNPGHTMRLYRLTEEWVESEVTWNDRASGVPWASAGADGPSSNAGVALNGDCTATGLRSLDIALFVEEWSQGAPNYGILLKDTGTDGVDFDSSESALPPVLTVVYQPARQAIETQPLSGTSDSGDLYHRPDRSERLPLELSRHEHIG